MKTMASIAKRLASRVTLNDGVEMPMFGLGVYLASSGQGGEAEKAVLHAINCGYRLIDTAEFYQNEADVGRAVNHCGVPRQEVFVASKLWTNGARRCKKNFAETLKKLGLEYLDLYFIHTPMDGKIVETYKTMLELKSQGKIRSVGVSNFGVHHLEGLAAAGLPAPSVNQIELHPWQRKEDIVHYCKQHDIAVEAYSPLVKGQRFNDPTLMQIAKRHNKTEAKILLRWCVQQGYIPIPKSSNPRRIEENMDVFDWSINQSDMDKLNNFPERSCTWNPCKEPWIG